MVRPPAGSLKSQGRPCPQSNRFPEDFLIWTAGNKAGGSWEQDTAMPQSCPHSEESPDGHRARGFLLKVVAADWEIAVAVL